MIHLNLFVKIVLFAWLVIGVAMVLSIGSFWRRPWELIEQSAFAAAASLQAVEDWFFSLDWLTFFEFVDLSVLPMSLMVVALFLVIEIARAFLSGAFAQAVR